MNIRHKQLETRPEREIQSATNRGGGNGYLRTACDYVHLKPRCGLGWLNSAGGCWLTPEQRLKEQTSVGRAPAILQGLLGI